MIRWSFISFCIENNVNNIPGLLEKCEEIDLVNVGMNFDTHTIKKELQARIQMPETVLQKISDFLDTLEKKRRCPLRGFEPRLLNFRVRNVTVKPLGVIEEKRDNKRH